MSRGVLLPASADVTVIPLMLPRGVPTRLALRRARGILPVGNEGAGRSGILRAMTATLVDLGTLQARLPELAEQYRSAQPFPHVVLDDVLFADAFTRAADEFPAMRDP